MKAHMCHRKSHIGVSGGPRASDAQPRQHEVGPTWYIFRLCVTDQTGPSLGVLGRLVRLRKVSLSTGHREPPNVVDV